MSNRTFKWKQVGKTAERLNRILRNDGFRLPNKFAPSSKDRSLSVDKVFNNSRSRLHQSLQITALNRTHQNQSMQLDKVSKVDSRGRQEQPIEKKNSAFLSVLPHSTSRNPTIINPSPKGYNSQLIADLKKEYLAFKKNILKELQRQREMVQKIVKEIVLTMELELENIKKVYSTRTQTISAGQIISIDPIKSIQQWKSTLKNVSLIDKSQTHRLHNTQTKDKRPQSPLKRQKVVDPPKIPINLDAFLGSFNTLQKKVKEMDRILEQPRSHIQLPI